MPSSDSSGPWLLDTHVWLWLMEGDRRLGRSKSLPMLKQAALDDALRVAPISIWEIGMLEARGRIRLNTECLQWVNSALDAPGIELVPFGPDIAVLASRLPGSLHGDPADRILIATARQLDLTLVTADRQLKAYGQAGYLKLLAV